LGLEIAILVLILKFKMYSFQHELMICSCCSMMIALAKPTGKLQVLNLHVIHNHSCTMPFQCHMDCCYSFTRMLKSSHKELLTSSWTSRSNVASGGSVA